MANAVGKRARQVPVEESTNRKIIQQRETADVVAVKHMFFDDRKPGGGGYTIEEVVTEFASRRSAEWVRDVLAYRIHASVDAELEEIGNE